MARNLKNGATIGEYVVVSVLVGIIAVVVPYEVYFVFGLVLGVF